MKKLLFIPLTIVLMFGLAFCAGDAPAQTKVLKFAFPMPSKSDMGATFDWYAAEVGKRSNGKVKIENYPMQSLVKMPQTIDAVLTGISEIGLIDTNVFARRFPVTAVFSLPTTTFPLTEKGKIASGEAFMNLYRKYVSLQKEYKEFKVLMCPGLNDYAMVSKKEIRLPDDLKGLKVGAAGMAAQITELCGGTPVSIQTPEAYMSLDRGVIDALFLSWGMVAARQIQEVSSYFLERNLTQLSLVAVMNLKTWNELPPDVRKIIDDLEHEALLFRTKQHMGLTGFAKGLWAKAGRTITVLSAEENRLWEEKGIPLEKKWLADMETAGKKDAPNILDELKRIRAGALE